MTGSLRISIGSTLLHNEKTNLTFKNGSIIILSRLLVFFGLKGGELTCKSKIRSDLTAGVPTSSLGFAEVMSRNMKLNLKN